MVFRDERMPRSEPIRRPPTDRPPYKHMAHNLIRKAPGKDSLRLKRKNRRMGRRLSSKASSPHNLCHLITYVYLAELRSELTWWRKVQRRMLRLREEERRKKTA